MNTDKQQLANDLKYIRKSKNISYYDMSISAGVSERTIENIIKHPEKSYLKKTTDKLIEYVRTELNKPEPLSIQDINFLRSQNERLKKQNDSLQEENNKYRQILLEVRTSLREVLFRWELPTKETQDKILHILKKISEVEE